MTCPSVNGLSFSIVPNTQRLTLVYSCAPANMRCIYGLCYKIITQGDARTVILQHVHHPVLIASTPHRV